MYWIHDGRSHFSGGALNGHVMEDIGIAQPIAYDPFHLLFGIGLESECVCSHAPKNETVTLRVAWTAVMDGLLHGSR